MSNTVEVELLSQPGCGPCVMSKRMLESLPHVDLTVRDVQQDEGAADIIRNHKDFSGTPVVLVAGIAYHGTDRDAIYSAIAAVSAGETLF